MRDRQIRRFDFWDRHDVCASGELITRSLGDLRSRRKAFSLNGNFSSLPIRPGDFHRIVLKNASDVTPIPQAKSVQNGLMVR
ncbi:hypothetical protein A6X21_05300 [Planctopirus hydrillae]|uniref:Uncharacterized protein n=1 Tax=Planctopirus hydrillae TaxID=1841610 RepID=A0A1C3EC83_9PLAN|nr:hypothetical protein A6X21_05300 [Planctopirus hydrillae]